MTCALMVCVSVPVGPDLIRKFCRSTSGVDDLTHSETEPLPTTVVSVSSGDETYESALPAGFGCQFHDHCVALPQRPPPPVLGPKSVRGSAFASAVNELLPPTSGGTSGTPTSTH